MSELGALLRGLRGKRSLRDVAEATGLSHSYISDVEKGYRRGTKTPLNPSPDTLKKLSDAYDYPYEDLLEKAGYIEKSSLFRTGNRYDLEKDSDEVFLKKKNQQNQTTTVAGQEISISTEELRILEEIRKHPIMFHELAKDPEKNVKDIIKMWKFIKQDLVKEDDEEYFDEEIIED